MKKLISILFVAFVALASVAQAQVYTLYNSLGTNLLTDTVTNTGTGQVSIKSTTPIGSRLSNSTVVYVRVTKISGTVAGTITLQGSIDGTNYKAIPTVDTQTSVTTVTAADASADYVWRLNYAPFQYYRVSWTGSGTMSATLSAKLYRN